MLVEVFENLFEPNSKDEVLKRRSESHPFVSGTLWYKWADGGCVGILKLGRVADRKLSVVVEYIDDDGDELQTDWPVKYAESGKIAYDYPEYLTDELISAIEEAFIKKDELEAAND